MRFFLILCVTIYLWSCGDSENKKRLDSSPRKKSLTKVSQPSKNSTRTLGDTIQFTIETNDPNISIDSIVVTGKNKEYTFQKKSLRLSTKGLPLGKVNWIFNIHLDGKVEKKRIGITLLSDSEVKYFTYRILNEFPHDETAYVQGLFVQEGVLYESTGQKGESRLQKVDLQSGEIVASKKIDSNLFGEGSAFLNNQIYMLTWHSGRGFVFDPESLNPIREFHYPTEGWGLTAKEDTLIMTDGSENIYFMEPDGFTEVKRIQVYDNKGPIKSLNELEYIDGKIYANQWLTDFIYVIDPDTGKALAQIDLSGLLDETRWNGSYDVLNGIAYDIEKNRIFVTGKLWPRLFEVEFFERPKPL